MVEVFLAVLLEIYIIKFLFMLRRSYRLLQLVEIACAQNNVNKWVACTNLVRYALLLRHAAAHDGNQIGFDSFQFFDRADMSVYLLLGGFANTASVEHHYVGVLCSIAGRVAHFFQNTRYFFRIVDVHLTSVSVNKIFQNSLPKASMRYTFTYKYILHLNKYFFKKNKYKSVNNKKYQCMKRKFWKIFGIVTTVLMLSTVLGGVIFVDRFRKASDFVSFDKDKLNEVYTAVTVLDNEGNALSEPLYINNRKQIPLSALHDYTYNAFVAVEDKRFFHHNGIDYKRVAGALLHNLQSRGYKEGASTISQQLIKNTHLDNSKTLKRKLNEMMLAKELEKAYSKRDILEMYINTIYFGRNAYGIETAANVYFNKSATELTVSESAVLAGMIKAPNVYAPDKNADKCKMRRDTVLKLMKEQSFIVEATYIDALADPIEYDPQSSAVECNYVYSVMKEACALLNMTPMQLSRSDFVIETYCNQQTQKELVHLANEDETKCTDGKRADLSAIVLNNEGGVEACLLRGDTAGTKRQVGSALKPIAVYAPALNEKIITQASPILDEETNFNGYKPTNAGGYNGWTTVKYAVAKSLNVPAVKTLNALTLATSEKYLAQMGISGKQNLSLALGNATGGVDILTLAKCYSTLANDGRCNDVGFIKKIYSSNGLIYSRELSNKGVFQSEANYLMTDLLVNTVNNGTAKLLKKVGYPVAAKTGTVGNANGNSDALVAGYTTENTFCVWYSGNLSNDVNGATAPCSFAAKLLDSIYSAHKPSAFAVPKNVVQVDIDKESLYGDQLVLRCDNGEKFWFDKTNQPKEQVKEIRYDYRLNAVSDGNTVQISLPHAEGIWQLYRQSDGLPTVVELTGDCTIAQINCDTVFFAELYVKGKLVYTTPKVLTRYMPTIEQAPESEFPDLTDFWYWG